MQFSNDNLKKMDIKKMKYNRQYSYWYYGLYNELQLDKYKKRSDNINSCLDVWHWDKYDKNKILDLKSVNRCKNTRFCPNCKLLDISKFIHWFKDVNALYLTKGYVPYMLTLTIPSVAGEDLKSTIEKLNKSFRKLTEKYVYDINDKKSYKNRSLQFIGGFKVLEITYNNINGFHPHFHCVVYVKNIVEQLCEKKFNGKWSTKRNSYNKKSLIDIELGKLWSMIWYNLRLNNKNIDSLVYDPKETFLIDDKKNLEVDFIELDLKGLYEVFKYTFKDTDIENYYVFKTLVHALEGKRIRQGFGELYNIDLENIEVGELQELELKEKENPTSFITNRISELYIDLKDYKKISRFNVPFDNNIID